MKQLRPLVFDAENDDMEFNVWRNPVYTMAVAHTHTDIEINRVESGRITYFTSRGYEEMAEGDCAIFWAGMPHELVSSSNAELTWAVVPFSWFVQWRLPAAFADRLLQGEWLHPIAADRALDDALFWRWVLEQRHLRGPETTHIIALELEAWLRRAAKCVPPAGPGAREDAAKPTGKTAGASARHIERLAACMAQRYREPLTTADIAASAELHPHYAMEIWKHGCGLTLGDYLVRLRLSHAQRLLLTTDWTLERIAEESGFGSRARFYAAFKKRTGTSPRRWKMEQGGV